MDYNDGDFQSQKFHLAGEDNIKFSSGLQSFALPNFDLDQHLQVHSGFDNFVESRDLLTITGEEDNWINNFSPGRSAIGFSSNAAESCSISRHHNIWSEATSSESVEMLLKSVGEDDMMENKITAEKNNVSKEIKTTVTDSFASKMEDTIKNDLAYSLDTCENRLPEVSKGLVDSLTPVEVASSKDETPVQVRPMDLVGRSVKAEKLDIDHLDGEKLLPSPCSHLEDSRLVEQPHVAEATSVVPVVNDCQISISLSTRLENVQVDVDSQAGTSDINVDRAHVVIGVDGKDILHDKSGKLLQDQRVENEVSQESIEIDEKKTCGHHSGGSGDSPIAPTDSTIPLMGGCEEQVCPKAPNNRNSLVQIGIEQVNLPKEDSCRTSDQIVTSLEQNSTSIADLVENENITEDSTPLQNQSVAEAIDGCNVPLHSKYDDVVHVSDEQVEVAKGGSASGADIVTTPGQKSTVILEDVSRPEAVSFELKHESSKPSVSILEINPTSEAVEGCAEPKCSKNCDASVEIDAEPVEVVKGNLTSSQMSEASNEKHSETVPDVGGKEAQHVEINMDISEPSIPLVESVHQCDIIDREPSTGEEKHDSRSFQPENNDFGENDTSNLAEEAYLFSCETDKKPMSELREVDKQSIQELDVMVTNKSPEGCPEEDTVQKRPDLSAEISNSRELPSSSASLGTPSPVLENSSPRPELVEDRNLIITAFPIPVSSVCSGGGSKSGQIPSESCLSHVVSYNSQSETLHTSVSDSENKAPISDGCIPGKTPSSSEASNSVQAFVPAAILPNEDLQSTMVDVAESECVVVMEGLPIAAIDEEKDAPDKLHFEESVKEALDVSVAGNTLNLKSDSELAASSHKVIEDSSPLETGSCHNSFDHGCQSPKTISCSQNPHDGGENKDESKALSEKVLSIPSDLSSPNKESHGLTESLVENPKGSNVIKDDKSFTFEVGKISEGEKNIMWKPFSSIQTSEGAQSCEEVPRKSGYDQGDFSQTKTSQGSGRSNPNDPVHRNASKEERRSIAASGSSSKKKLSKDEPFSKKRTERDDNSNTRKDGYAFGNGSKDLQLGAIQPCPSVEGVIVKSSCSSAAQASNLPDLNTATSTHLLINKPFTDIQQVQLRAQIFVYGSLIQGIPPDETCMISAFGDSDAGRSAWEGVWRAAVEKHENHRSPLAGCETPASHSVTKTDQSLKRTLVQSKMVPTPSCQSGSKGPPTIFSPLSWPSPVWTGSAHDKLHSSMPRGSYANQMLSPLHPYQSPHVRSYTGNISPWLTQTTCSVPWITHTATPDISSPLPVMPVTETAHVTSRGTSLPSGSNIQFKSSGGSSASGGVGVVSTNSEVQVTATRKEVTPRSKKPISSDQKSRRRKKCIVPEPFGHTLPISEPRAELLPVTVPTPAKTSSGASSAGFLQTVSPALSYTPFQVVGAGQKVLFSEETCSKIEQAKLHAEDAAVFASAAVRHSEAIWSQLAIQKNSGKTSEVERKLASAAVAAAAAVSVAKAASAAAKVAADSALHAKMMADEAMSSGNVGKSLQSSGTVDPSEENDDSAVTPSSTFTGKDKNNSSYSIIPAAREAARRRLEAASAATKQAENLDAIVRAAELAAEAVCQAGSIAAMGDPLPFSLREIIEAGPGGYWKTQQLKSEHIIKAKSLHGEKQLTISNQLLLHESEVHASEKEVLGTAGGDAICSPTEASEEQKQKNEGHSPQKITDSADKKGQPENDLIDGTIQKGSLVEVLSNVKGPGGVWYSGRVLDLKDDKAYVRYNERPSDEGSDKTKEWVPLHSEAEKAPSIRIAHPIAAQKAGARKRRRTVDLWFVGDRVDAWVNDGWREGVITEKSDEDTPNFVVHFAAGGDTSVFRSWDLRPSLVWKDGQWVEWCRSLNNISKHLEIQGDVPQQKRIKMSDTVGKNITDTVAARPSRISRNLRSADSKKLEEFVPLQLDPKERLFSFGKIREENVPERIKRIGLQKEGSKVVFGIPKPGKKRKFMDMSKHCVVGNTEKTRAGSQGSDPAKYAKTFIPQASGGWKNVSKADARNKRGAVEKPKVPRPRSRNVHNQPSASNGNSSVSALRTSNGQGNGYGVAAGRSLEKKNVNDIDSSANSTATAQGLSNLLSSPAISPAIKSADVDADETWGNNILHDMEKATSHEERCSGHVDDSGKMAHDIIEPRRSVRRIQPTSRLLEGLQSSSLSITKSSGSSHDRGGRASHKAGSSSRVHAHR